jgi:hypothetical protein
LGFVEWFEFPGYSFDPVFDIGRLRGSRECRTVLILNGPMVLLLWRSRGHFIMTDARAIRQAGKGVMFPRKISTRTFGRAKVVGIALVRASLCVVVGTVRTIAVGEMISVVQERKTGQVKEHGSIRRLRSLGDVIIDARLFKRELVLVKNYISWYDNLTWVKVMQTIVFVIWGTEHDARNWFKIKLLTSASTNINHGKTSKRSKSVERRLIEGQTLITYES